MMKLLRRNNSDNSNLQPLRSERVKSRPYMNLFLEVLKDALTEFFSIEWQGDDSEYWTEMTFVGDDRHKFYAALSLHIHAGFEENNERPLSIQSINLSKSEMWISQEVESVQVLAATSFTTTVLMMEAERTSETLANFYQATRQNVLDDWSSLPTMATINCSFLLVLGRRDWLILQIRQKLGRDVRALL